MTLHPAYWAFVVALFAGAIVSYGWSLDPLAPYPQRRAYRIAGWVLTVGLCVFAVLGLVFG